MKWYHYKNIIRSSGKNHLRWSPIKRPQVFVIIFYLADSFSHCLFFFPQHKILRILILFWV